MVDIATHKKLHRDDNSRSQRAPPLRSNVLDAKYMSEDSPDLRDDFFMCLPTSIFGFNMNKKEWGKCFIILLLRLILTHLSQLGRTLPAGCGLEHRSL
jgi:hypothetical protein